MTTKVKSFYDKLIAEGLEQGMEKGLREEKTNTIHRMVNLGFLVSQIAAVVELSEEEVVSILKAS